jgi:hypothetical protein
MTFTRYPTNRLSLLPGVSFGLPAFKSQQVPVQLDATALQAANSKTRTGAATAQRHGRSGNQNDGR